jgi:taurine dioxygenase
MTTIDVRPIAGALGAEIHGVDLARQLDNRTADEIYRAFLDHVVIFFRDQAIEPDGLKSLARRFGAIGHTPFIKHLDEHPEIIEVVRPAQPKAKGWNFGAIWHSDLSFKAEPPKATVLQAKATPPFGGDTMFANQYAAYDALSEGMKTMLDPLKAIHCALRSYGPQGAAVTGAAAADPDAKGLKIESSAEAFAEQAHPVVRRHPETGRKCLFVNASYTTRFAGMTAEESAPLLKYLLDHAVRPEFTCRFAWRPNSIALWDNRCAQHFAVDDYYGYRRVMHRITVAGDRPV